MQKTILVSNQRHGEYQDLLEAFGIDEAKANQENLESIDNLWGNIEDNFDDENLILIVAKLNGKKFSLVSHKTVSYDELAKMLGVDYYMFNGYL